MFSLSKSRSDSHKGLKQELAEIKIRIDKTQHYMDELSSEFWRNGGNCCEGCGIRGWNELVDKQIRRDRRIQEIVNKIIISDANLIKEIISALSKDQKDFLLILDKQQIKVDQSTDATLRNINRIEIQGLGTIDLFERDTKTHLSYFSNKYVSEYSVSLTRIGFKIKSVLLKLM